MFAVSWPVELLGSLNIEQFVECSTDLAGRPIITDSILRTSVPSPNEKHPPPFQFHNNGKI